MAHNILLFLFHYILSGFFINRSYCNRIYIFVNNIMLNFLERHEVIGKVQILYLRNIFAVPANVGEESRRNKMATFLF